MSVTDSHLRNVNKALKSFSIVKSLNHINDCKTNLRAMKITSRVRYVMCQKKVPVKYQGSQEQMVP